MSALELVSIIPPVSALSDAIIFSPFWNVPDTLTKSINVPASPLVLAEVFFTKPVAPDVTPCNLTPVECVAVRRGSGVPSNCIRVNI